MYIKLRKDGTCQKYSLDRLKIENPNTSFPKNPTKDILKKYSVYEVFVPNKPEVNSLIEYVKEDGYVLNDDVWEQKWKVERFDENEAMTNVRNKRNDLLTKSDWTQAKDIPDEISSLWVNYRQELRDITKQANFPWNVNWPSIPGE